MFKFVVKKVISKAKAVRCVIEGHVHVEALLGDVQVARLPVCQRRNSSGDRRPSSAGEYAERVTFYLQGLQTRFSGCSNNSHAVNTCKNINDAVRKC